MNADLKQIIEQGDKLFERRLPLMNLWQEIADNFYVEVADFTVSRSFGTDFAANLMTSYPILARRDLGDTVGAMARPTSKEWFHTSTNFEVKDVEGRAWLEWATGVQRRAMYDIKSQFVRSTKSSDHDYVAFGQGVLTAEVNDDRSGLKYRSWHLRDVAWCDDENGSVESVHHKYKLTCALLNRRFKGNLAPALKDKLEKDPYYEVKCRRVVVPSDMYRGEKQWRTKWVSLHIDVENNFCMEEMGQRTHPYIIPRWKLLHDSQYAFSPATICALPDARLIQAMTLVLLEAGEKATNPPMVAHSEVFRGDMNLFAGGVTWADLQGDSKISDAFSVLSPDKSGMPFGIELRNDTREMISQAFYLNKVNLPPIGGPDMTAYEVGQRVQEYIRQAMPLFEPLESDYNGALCERTFDLLLHNGAFGPPDNIPQSLSRAEIQFKFESPLSDAIDKQKAQVFVQGADLLAKAVALDPSSAAVVDAAQALRDSLQGIGFPASWTRSTDQVAAIQKHQAEQQQEQQLLASLGQAADIAKTSSEAQAAAV